MLGHDRLSCQSLACPYFGIILPRGIKVMVIGGETTGERESTATIMRQIPRRLRFLQTSSLFWGQHSKRGAHLHTHPSDLSNHGQNALESALPSREISPSCTHTESRTPIFFRLTSGLEDGLDVHEWRCLGRGRVSRGLRAV